MSLKGRAPEYAKYKEQARSLATARLLYWKTHPAYAEHNFVYGRISIKNVKSRWGSCSKKGNLNFNYHIALLPPHLADYIIVHELCHLSEFNHGKGFWDLVAKAVPAWRELREELKKTQVLK